LNDTEFVFVRGGLPIVLGRTTLTQSFELELNYVKKWWPRGYGEPNVYQAKVTVLDAAGTATETEIASHMFTCGFRTCELVQDPVGRDRDQKKGDAFHFRVNGVDIFAKGSNWIPGHVFDRLMTMDKKRSLLLNCVAANMNMIRIWGGGRYESDGIYYLFDYYWYGCNERVMANISVF
jgi:beta-mannosidase